jgi:TPR repeat protein
MNAFRTLILAALLAGSETAALSRAQGISGLDSCDGSDYLRCDEAAGRMAAAAGQQANPQGALVLSEWLCGNLFQPACQRAARLKAAGVAVDRETARAWLDSCHAGNAVDCFASALVQTGSDEPRETTDLLDRACKGAELRACSRLAYTYLQHDKERARDLYRKGCETRHFGCELLVDWYSSAQGGHRFAEARRLVEADCGGAHPTGCYALGRLLYGSTGGPRDVPAAAKAFKRSCDLGDAASCNFLALIHSRHELGVSSSGKTARLLWERSCKELDNRDGCLGLARDDHRAGRAADAEAVYIRLCDGGMPAACNDLADCIMAKRCSGDRTRARSLYGEACRGKIADACVNEGAGYANGCCGDVDITKAFEAQKRGCELGSALGCANIAAHLRKTGDPVNADVALARACSLNPIFCPGRAGRDGGAPP